MLQIALFIAYFIFCQIIAERNKIPAWLQKLTMGKLIWVAIACIMASGMISVLLGNSVAVVLVTVWYASIIAARYRNKFENMERGEI